MRIKDTHVNREDWNGFRMLIDVRGSDAPVAFNWNLVDSCQFKCSYCYASRFNEGHRVEDGSVDYGYSFALTRLKKIDCPWMIDIQGGEPTIHDKLPHIINQLNEMPNCIGVVVATNLTKPPEYYSQLDVSKKIEIHASYHPEYHKKWTSRFIELDRVLTNASLFVEVLLVPDPQYYTQTIEFMQVLSAASVKHGVTIARPTPDWNPSYTDDFYTTYHEWIYRDHQSTPPIMHTHDDGTVEVLFEHDIFSRGIKYTGMMCKAQMYTIDVDGTIFNTCTRVKLPLSIKTATLQHHVICPVNRTCDCSAMLHYRKTR